MDTPFTIAAGALTLGGALALGATAGPTALLLAKSAILRRSFARSASWWIDVRLNPRMQARPVRRHRAHLAWTSGRTAPVRRLVRRAVLAAAAVVDELTMPGRLGVAA